MLWLIVLFTYYSRPFLWLNKLALNPRNFTRGIVSIFIKRIQAITLRNTLFCYNMAIMVQPP